MKKPLQKAKAATQKVQRKAQAQGGALKDVLTEDTGSTLGAAGILGLAVVVAGALVLGSERPSCVLSSPTPAVPAGHACIHDGEQQRTSWMCACKLAV